MTELTAVTSFKLHLAPSSLGAVSVQAGHVPGHVGGNDEKFDCQQLQYWLRGWPGKGDCGNHEADG